MAAEQVVIVYDRRPQSSHGFESQHWTAKLVRHTITETRIIMAKDVAKATESHEVERFETGAVLVNTFSSATLQDKARAYLAIDDVKSLRKEKMVNVVFGLTNALVREETYTDKNGDIRDSKSVILEAGAGTSYRMSSETLADSLNNLLTAFGDPSTWDEPLMVQVVDGIGSNGFTYYKIVPAIPAD